MSRRNAHVAGDSSDPLRAAARQSWFDLISGNGARSPTCHPVARGTVNAHRATDQANVVALRLQEWSITSRGLSADFDAPRDRHETDCSERSEEGPLRTSTFTWASRARPPAAVQHPAADPRTMRRWGPRVGRRTAKKRAFGSSIRRRGCVRIRGGSRKSFGAFLPRVGKAEVFLDQHSTWAVVGQGPRPGPSDSKKTRDFRADSGRRRRSRAHSRRRAATGALARNGIDLALRPGPDASSTRSSAPEATRRLLRNRWARRGG